MSAAPELPALPRERLPIAMQRAETELVSLVPDPAASRLLDTAKKARNATQRAASAWSTPLQAVSACKKGCDHSCHIPLTISQAEAELIGRAAGRRPVVPATSIRLLELCAERQDWQAVQEQLQASRPKWPCPFLVDHECEIHEARPLACWVLLNLDDDELLCRQVEGVETSVPYVNAMQLKAHYLALQPAGVLADIRGLFPSLQTAT
ncbi:Fe-S-cluster containining protein [Variovorax paradoxus]|uniref:hypothetical protein n=1 Tax=Variovorax atrisoli TaxID=3394203 RepID=UPI0011999D5C|nr:hypothetical protein [Variovorax paradoxus]MDR6521622.1 Fe-S-cluster containining protein [Variovorax paradoxus]